jgi:hypothetical protein
MLLTPWRAVLLATVLVPLAAHPVLAQSDVRTERVGFERGANSTFVEDSITGYETVDYVLGAREGQYPNISMATDNGANYFNIIPPGEADVAMFNGSIAENQYEGVLPASGDYKVQVYLMRSAARRDEVANYRLEMIIADVEEQSSSAEPEPAAVDVPAAPEDGGPRNWEVSGIATTLNLREQPSTSAQTISSYAPGTILDNLGCLRAEGRVWCDVQELGGGPRGYVAAEFLAPAVSPDGSVATGPDMSALRAGQGDFDATGQIPCAQSPGQPMGQCDFGVARAGGGSATVVVTRPDGTARAIFFSNGTAIGADTSEAGGGGAFSADRESDLNLIRVGDERYEIPDAVVLGG